MSLTKASRAIIACCLSNSIFYVIFLNRKILNLNSFCLLVGKERINPELFYYQAVAFLRRGQNRGLQVVRPRGGIWGKLLQTADLTRKTLFVINYLFNYLTKFFVVFRYHYMLHDDEEFSHINSWSQS